MEEYNELFKILEQVFDNPNKDECKPLNKLWQKLAESKFPYQEGPYPAGHGKAHIKNLLSNLSIFLKSYSSDKARLFTDPEKCQLLAAGMIHDINMIHMRPVGTIAPYAEQVRITHACPDKMRKTALSIIETSGFSKASAEHIIEIASSHAGDDKSLASRKLNDIKSRQISTGTQHLFRFAVLIQVADFFDLGPDRLTRDVSDQEWDEKQISHYKKHAIARVNFDERSKLITLYLGKDDEISVGNRMVKITPMDRYKIIYTIYEEAKDVISRLNEAFSYTNIVWKASCDESLFGKISPMGSDLDLFRKEFESAFEAWSKDRIGVPFPVDFMGHSLYGRFVKDEEDFNKLIKKHLSQSGIKLRALVLDPSVENQQMCEVFEAQLGTPEEKGRAILPLYDDQGKIKDQDEKGNIIEGKGDIVKSLDALKAWETEIVGNSSLEVRTTSRLMYMSIARFGNSIIVTPYRRKGLFKESVALVFKEGAPLYDAYREVFDDIWKSWFETTIKLFKYPGRSPSNPVAHFLPKRQTRREKPNLLFFDYERFLLDTHIERIKAVFDNLESIEKKPIPPFEIEIQPSEECTLHCVHCIGKHLSQRRGNPTILQSDLHSLLDYQVSGWKVQRFRISGLLGDPLSDSIRPFTLGFLKKAKEVGREVIILTNGVALKEESVQQQILQADCIHVSLDAASRKTFLNLKGEDYFDIVKESITELCNNIRQKKSLLTKLGLGFVVTQGNAHEVTDAIALAKEVGSHFIRFKPDIRGMHAISWRTWKEAEAKIEQYRLKEESLDIILTDAGWSHYRVPVVDRCWAQYFYTTVGSDNNLYPCDHLTANGRETALGGLGIFRDIWENSIANNKLGRRHRQCILCPPFGWRLNRLVEQLHVLYKENNWDTVKKWVDEALKAV